MTSPRAAKPAEQPSSQIVTKQSPETGKAPKRPAPPSSRFRADIARTPAFRYLINVALRLAALTRLPEDDVPHGESEETLRELARIARREKFIHKLHTRDDLDDSVWIKDVSLATGIPESSERFVRDALATRRLRLYLDALHAEIMYEHFVMHFEGECVSHHPFLRRLDELVDAADPTQWRVCSNCGQCPEGSYSRVHCKVCQGSGYEVP